MSRNNLTLQVTASSKKILASLLPTSLQLIPRVLVKSQLPYQILPTCKLRQRCKKSLLKLWQGWSGNNGRSARWFGCTES